ALVKYKLLSVYVFRSYSPSTGGEWLVRFNYKPSKSVSAFIQMREETKQRNTSTDNNLYLTSAATRRNYWVNIDYAATQQLSLKSRVQLSTFEFDRSATSGIVLLQDVSYSRQRWTLAGRYAIFDTENYDNRLYVYERDVWLAFTFPAYSGKGTRQYLLLQYKLSQNIDIWLRWSQTRYLNKDTIGSGGETIMGNTDNDVKFQVRWLF
ncbi:MAG: helix-hairpin-helix domain-containing protein, partial [Flammeovirgaceae bacterium]